MIGQHRYSGACYSYLTRDSFVATNAKIILFDGLFVLAL